MEHNSGLTVPKVYGDVGEIFAREALQRMGYKVCRADSIQEVGHSLLVNGSLKELDCGKLCDLAQLCADLLRCEARRRPCRKRHSRFYSFNPNRTWEGPDTEENRFTYHCAHKMSYLVILDRCRAICNTLSCPLKAYLQIDNYIHNLYDHMYHTDRDAWNRLHSLRKWGGHPGRIDLFGYKGGRYYCLEVKVNTGKLLKWQLIRLSWMKSQGFEARIVRVRWKCSDRRRLLELYTQHRIGEAIEMLNPELAMEELDIRAYPDWMSCLPSVEEVDSYNRIGYRWADMEWK